jgi:toxin FitB
MSFRPPRRIDVSGRRLRRRRRAWIIGNQQHLFIPVISIVEIAAGIGAREGNGTTRHATELAAWLKAILGIYAERVLVLDAEAALHARALILKARAAGKMVGFADLTVACIARARGLGPVVN